MKCFIYPTDTVWGLGAPLEDLQGQQKIREIKGRDASSPFSILFPSLSLLNQIYPDLPPLYSSLLRLGVTLLVSQENFTERFDHSIVGTSSLVGLRVFSSHWPDLSELFENCPGAVTTTSLNLSGAASITSEKQAIQFHQKYFPSAHLISPRPELVLGNLPSTIINTAQRPFLILREGHRLEEVKSLLSQND